MAQQRAEEVAKAVLQDQIVVCLPFLLKVGFSARSYTEHVSILDELGAMPSIGIDELVESRALSAQRDLARSGHHRMTPTDLLIAALADRAGFGVLHYDSDYDLILEHTRLRFDSVWLAPLGTL